MKVLILHYHLNPGGVTRVIESQIKALRECDDLVELTVLCGQTPPGPAITDVPVIQDCLLNYTRSDVALSFLSENVGKLLALIRSYLGSNTLIHCHNLNLGKNPALTAALYRLATEGYPVINHCHDFPEDRPGNWELLERVIPSLTGMPVKQVLYPVMNNYHFIVLNSCDYNRLRESGINGDHVHMIMNPVAGFSVSEVRESLRTRTLSALDLDESLLLCTYPVRAIRRKNIGEFILMAVLFKDKASFALTLPPLNPSELPAYEGWKKFCAEKSIHVRFEASKVVNYDDLIKISDFCITTSIREGFGMVYLEPWLAGIPVIGRELPCVITDLKSKGMEFPRLYRNLIVEVGEEKRDFKDLTLGEQEKVITGAIENSGYRSGIMKSNPFLDRWLDKVPVDVIQKNQTVIHKEFALQQYGRQIFGIYQKISG